MRYVFCIVPSRGLTDRIVVNLRDAGFLNTEVSVLFLDQSTPDDPFPAGSPPDPSAGPIRGVFTWIAGIHRIVLPDIAPLIVGGPIAAMFSAASGKGIAGRLMAFGIPEKEAQVYADRVLAGHLFISVQTENPEKTDQAREMFSAAGAESVCTKMDVSTPKHFSRDIKGLPRISAA